MTGPGALSVLALARSEPIRDAIAGALTGRGGVTLEVEVGRLEAGNGAFAARLGAADILLVDIDPSDQQELAALQRLVEEQRGRASILATTADLTPTAARQLVRRGVDDLVPQPLTDDDLRDAIDLAARRLRQRRSGARPPGRVLGFMRAKGGMGATTLAVHAALCLQSPPRQRPGEPPRSVCLLDLDLQFGDAALCLDLEVGRDSFDLFRTAEPPCAAQLVDAMISHKSGLSVLPAPLRPIPLEALRGPTATQLIGLAREVFDYTVIDLPLALAGWVEPALTCVDHLLVVTQLGVPAIRRTRRLLDLLQDEGLHELPISLVLNRHSWGLGERQRLKQVVQALGRPIDDVIPDQGGLVQDAANRGLAIFDLRRRSQVGRAITAMTERCVKLLEPTRAPATSAA